MSFTSALPDWGGLKKKKTQTPHIKKPSTCTCQKVVLYLCMAATRSLSLPPSSNQRATSPALGDGVLMEAAAAGVGCTMPWWLQTAASPVLSGPGQGDGEMPRSTQHGRTQPCKHTGWSIARHSLPAMARSLSGGTGYGFCPSMSHMTYLYGFQCSCGNKLRRPQGWNKQC